MNITIPQLFLPADVPALNNKKFVEACNWLTRAYDNERTQLNEYVSAKNNTRVNQQKMFLISIGKYVQELHNVIISKQKTGEMLKELVPVPVYINTNNGNFFEEEEQEPEIKPNNSLHREYTSARCKYYNPEAFRAYHNSLQMNKWQDHY